MRETRSVALVLSLFLSGCGSSTQPAGPTPATPAPTPTPTPSPAPTPSPTPKPPSVKKCELDDSESQSCSKELLDNGQYRTNFYADVQKAQREVKDNKPGLFDGHKIRNEAQYMAAVYLQLLADGYCATVGPSHDEISVKIGTNTYSETYDLIFGGGQSPTTDYSHTCRPSAF